MQLLGHTGRISGAQEPPGQHRMGHFHQHIKFYGQYWFAVGTGDECRFVPHASRSKQLFLKGKGYDLTSVSPSDIYAWGLCVKPDSISDTLLNLFPKP